MKSTELEVVQFVRKRIKNRRTTAATERVFVQEKDCLELYHTLQHPNIIPLLGSFTFKGEHSLLFTHFPMDLEAFFKNDERFGDFHQDNTFTAALADLASALQFVHEANIRCKKTPLFLNSYGYHHDIRPANILVTSSTFILADFGLAYPTPTTTTQPPTSLWTENIGHYIAPECMDQNFQPQLVGRSYDIWAFGCLVSEVVTYMQHGPTGIQDFRQKRLSPKYHEENFENGYFFEATSLKPSVFEWLQRLADSSVDNIASSLVGLCLDMLKHEPQNRKDMTVACIRLSFIHSKSLFKNACDLIDETLSKFGQPRYEVSANTVSEFKAEASKLRAFGTLMGLDDRARLDSELFRNHSFATTVQQRLEQISVGLRQSRKTLTDYQRSWTSSGPSPNSSNELIPLKFIDESVRQGIRALSEALPLKYQTFLSYLWLKKLTEGMSDGFLDNLKDIEAIGEESPDMYRSIGLRARLLRLNEALHGHMDSGGPEERDLVLDWSQVQITSTFSRYHHVGSYYHGDSGAGDKFLGAERLKVLVEWIFPSQFAEDEPEDERIDKLLTLANLLKCPKPEGFHVLNCIGFLPPQETAHQGFGFVYGFPETTEEMEPKTLRQLLEQRSRPVRLGDKFKLAKNLSRCLFEFHGHGWLHKNIRSDNVLFFAKSDEWSGSSKPLRLDHGPFLVGTHHSRPDNPEFHSDVPSADMDAEVLLYQHPDYNQQGNRFHKSFDYYSLGLILLEVAYWYPVQTMWAKSGRTQWSPRQFRTKLIDKFVPKLSEIVGDAYREATLMCLSGDLSYEDQDSADSGITSRFYWDVVQKLDACFVG